MENPFFIFNIFIMLKELFKIWLITLYTIMWFALIYTSKKIIKSIIFKKVIEWILLIKTKFKLKFTNLMHFS